MKHYSPEAQQVLRFINQTNKSIFLTGKAGTGKTTLLKEILITTHKNTVVVAPTGIAALNAEGVTIHSLFQLPFATFIPDYKEITTNVSIIKMETRTSLLRHFKMNMTKRSLFNNLELLIIDEVSMLRADVLDAIDFMLKRTRRNELPFGGIQVLFIGDLLQLPPVVKNEEWHILKDYYQGMYFFNAHILQQFPPLYLELTTIYRQSDSSFVSILNNLRTNNITKKDIKQLNLYVKPSFNLKENPGYVYLTTHNSKANQINQESLQELKKKSHSYFPEIVGDFPEKLFPLDSILELKIGAQIMFIKNDLNIDKQYYNGKMGVIETLSDDEIKVRFPEEKKTITVDKYEWKNIKFTVNSETKEIEEEILGTFVHYPIKLAWAITVHKSQGLTFEKAALDVSDVFAPGQAYVALSRLRSLTGLVLLSPLQMHGITNDVNVLNYVANKVTEETLNTTFKVEKQRFIYESLCKGFNFKGLIQEWRNHFYSYKTEESKSVKFKHMNWITILYEKINTLETPSEKFIKQLTALFIKQAPDFKFINERCEAAFTYFFNVLDHIYGELLYKIEEIKRTKQAKTFFNELILLEEIHNTAILILLKTKTIANSIEEEYVFSKERLQSKELNAYKSEKLKEIQSQFKKENPELLEEENISYYKKTKGNKTSVNKKTTIEETFELWQQNLSVEAIAIKRKLTEATIYSHFVKLIQNKSIKINEILSDSRIDVLQVAFEEYENISQIKEAYNSSFTWEELKLFKASLGLS
ncbi:helix-turn-helix domain-containing protein [Flavobacterium sp. J27]|uniref:helix-turn-helix domain-containing protein n=1 Tax=Flavobacterium sp. J27 TaxID=2060419 RepID=UPI0010316867|nr:helix-turn-helix domain-containing protein [Flavobacterium sp. J27]